VSQGSPRISARRVDALRLFSPSIAKYGLDHVAELLISEGVDDLGLRPSQRLYLQTLAASPRGACSLERLAIKLGCDTANLRQDVEPYLNERGWVEPHSGRGRMITPQARGIIPRSTSDDDAGES
jgi:Holliday junction resolvasome RuvABC ATP-dependent DNA helicase subunit